MRLTLLLFTNSFEQSGQPSVPVHRILTTVEFEGSDQHLGLKGSGKLATVYNSDQAMLSQLEPQEHVKEP